MVQGVDRRVHPRLPLRMLVQFRAPDMDSFMRDFAANISVGGMFIKTTEPFPFGAMIYLQFQLADGNKLIEGLGKVVHVNPPEHPSPGIGVEFVNLDPESTTLIEQIIADRAVELEPES